jgi:hypothetical protein
VKLSVIILIVFYEVKMKKMKKSKKAYNKKNLKPSKISPRKRMAMKGGK